MTYLAVYMTYLAVYMTYLAVSRALIVNCVGQQHAPQCSPPLGFYVFPYPILPFVSARRGVGSAT